MTCKAHEIKTDYYLPEEDEAFNFRIDQTIIGNELFLKHLIRYRKHQIKDVSSDSSLSDWYPYVNSYYPYTEDVDAYARVNHLLGSKPSFASISSASERTQHMAVHDKIPYSESAAQNHYLQSNPVSFIIIGKPDIGERELGQMLADFWQCVYIDPEIIIEQEILSGSRAGQCIEFNLRSGRAIGIDVILRLVEKRTKSESSKHRGFVICGLPLIPNDLYQEDPISSESAVFTAKEIFEEIFDVADKLLPQIPTKPPASVVSKYKSEDEEVEEEEQEGEFGEEEIEERTPKKQMSDKFPQIQIPIDVGPDFDVCQRPDVGTNYEDQLNFVFSLLKPPFMIIYIMCSSADVIEKRRNYRFDVNSKRTINLQTAMYNDLIFTIHDEQENLDEELLEDFVDTEYLNIDTSRLDYLVKLPRHFPANVATQLDAYNYTGLHFIERRVLMHDPQYFLKVDGRVNVKRMLRIVKSRLKILPLQRVIIPTRLTLEPTYAGEGAGAQEQTDLEYLYGELTRTQVPSNIFKWHWSDWGSKCPVALKEGNLKYGDSKYAVHFMNKIFLLASEENFFKFYWNPRPYLLPPNPKPVCKIFVFGPTKSGKTAVSQCLGFLLNGTVLSFKDMLAHFIFNQEEELKENRRKAATIEALQLLQEIREKEAKQVEMERIEKIKEWMVTTRQLIENFIEVMIEKEQKTVTSFEISSFPMAMRKVSLLETENPLVIEFIRLKDQLRNLNIPVYDKVDDMRALLSDKRKLLSHLPVSIRSKMIFKPATVNDPFVQDFVKDAIEHVALEGASTTNKNLANIVHERIREVEDEGLEHSDYKRGWVIDGMTCDFIIIEEMYPDFMPSEVITLLDEDDSNFLTNRYECEGDTQFTEYREFFFNIGQVDAAWRAPPHIPKATHTTRIVQQILYDIINDPRYFDYQDDGPISKIDLYRIEIQSFQQKWLNIKQYFLDHNVVPIEVKVTDKSLTVLMEEIVEAVLNKYRIGASLFTELDRAEEVKNYGNQMLQKNLGEGPDFDDTAAFDENRRYGDTYKYCPVTFREKGVLWKGKEDYAVKFEEKLFLLSSEEDMNKFLKVPRSFLTGEVPQTFPPPRLCVTGIPGTGRTTVAKALASNYGLVYVSFEALLKKYFSITSTHSLDQLRRNQNVNAILNSYLNMDVPLPEELLYNILFKFWFEQPIVGFVLDDFPKRPSDVKVMTHFKLIPDMILNLTNNTGQIKNKIVMDSLKRWKIEVNEKNQIAENNNKLLRLSWEEKRKYRFEELIEERRARRYAAKIEHMMTSEMTSTDQEEDEEKSKFKGESQVSFDSVAEQEDANEVNQLLEYELPQPLVQDVLETMNEARDKFETLAMDTLHVEGKFLKNIQSLCSTNEIPCTDVTADFEYPELTIRRSFFISDKFKFRNSSYFERCYDVSMEAAEILLDCGYLFLSKFGKTCPIQHYEDKIPVQMYLPMEARNNLFPVIHRSYIYYLTGKENQEKFKQDPLKYIHVENFNFPLINIKVAVTGPPKCGKTVLSRRIASEYGFKLITRGEAARYVLTFLPLSYLAKCMEAVLRQGWELTDEMVVKCVEAAAFDSKAVTQGIVFDGFPNTITEARHLSYIGSVPNLDIDLLATHDEVLECLSFDGDHRGLPRFSVAFMKHLLEEWNTYCRKFRNWFDREYQVTTQIRINTSNWSVWYQTEKYLKAVFFEIKHYYIHATDDWPLRLANMQITPLEFLERQGAFKTYCPCCLHYFKRLTRGGDPPDRTGLVQYRFFFYWVCAEHIETFLNNPDIFLIPYNASKLPQVLPDIVHLKSMPDNVFEDGLCIVCYKNRRIYTKGKLNSAVTYNNRVYLFTTKECLKQFMANPTKFRCDISFKPPKNYPLLNYKDLPILGMLEQYLAKLITKSLSFVVRNRPVIPGLQIHASALIAMGLYLKLFNPNIQEEYRPLFKEGDDLFNQRRLKLINYLDKMKSVINPYLYYENPLPDFEVPDTELSVTSESITTTVAKILDVVVDDVDCDTDNECSNILPK